MVEQKELDQPVAAGPAHHERRPTERRTTEERLHAVETMVVRPDWLKRVDGRLADLEHRISSLVDDHLHVCATINSRLDVLNASKMQNEIPLRDRTTLSREAHEKHVMDEALSRRREAEDRIKVRAAEVAAEAKS